MSSFFGESRIESMTQEEHEAYLAKRKEELQKKEDPKQAAKGWSLEAVGLLAQTMIGKEGASISDQIKSAITILEVAGYLSHYYEDE